MLMCRIRTLDPEPPETTMAASTRSLFICLAQSPDTLLRFTGYEHLYQTIGRHCRIFVFPNSYYRQPASINPLSILRSRLTFASSF